MPVVNRPQRQPQPRNRGSVQIAQSAIKALTPVIQEQGNNALSVDGYSVLWYHRKDSGMRCTCSLPNPAHATNPDGSVNTGALPEEPGVHVLNPDGSGTQAYLSSLLNGGTIKIERYGSRNHETDNPQRALPHSPLNQSANVINKSGDFNDAFTDEVEEFDTQDLFNSAGLDTLDDNLRIANNENGCGVCMGTGWVGGYDLLNGWRKVLDSRAASNLSGITQDQSVYPQALVLDTNTECSAQFEITMPIGAVGVDCIRLWNDRTQVTHEFVWETYRDGSWHTLDAQTLLSICDGMVHSIRVRFQADSLTTRFTHIEIQLDLGQKPYLVDWPQRVDNQNLQLPENIEPVSMLVSAYVPKVTLYDVVTEQGNERQWLVTSTTHAINRNRSSYGWEVMARLVQRYEYASLLWVKRTPHVGDRMATAYRPKAADNKID